MAATINPKITDAGRAAAINARANGLLLEITHIALGTGRYDSATLGAGMTAMADRREFVRPGVGVVTGVGGFRMMAMFEPWESAPYEATEIGYWAGEPGAAGSVLFAVYSHTSDVIVLRNSLYYTGNYVFQLVEALADAITIVIDPDGGQAQALLQLHLNDSNPHPQYVRKTGDTSTGAQFGVTAAALTMDRRFATTEFVAGVGVRLPISGGIFVSAYPVTLSRSDLGRFIDLTGDGGNVTLPLASTCPIGSSFLVRVTTGTATITARDVDTIYPIGEANRRVMRMSRGEFAVFTRNGDFTWIVTSGGSRQPVGMVSAFSGGSSQAGWIPANGALLSRTAYADLFDYAQASGLVSDSMWSTGYYGRYSSGTSGDNFRVPDLRAAFIRSLADGSSIDPGRERGRIQWSQNLSHQHGGTTGIDGHHTHANSVPMRRDDVDRGSSGNFSLFSIDDAEAIAWGGSHAHAFMTDPSGTTESRPVNIALPYFIKY